MNLKFNSIRTLLACACFLHASSNRAEAADFTLRQVTNFGNRSISSGATPLAVLNNQLLFLGVENNRFGLYRTDGNSVHLIDDSVRLPLGNSFTAIESIQLGNELYFAAKGSDGRELYATDGQSLRQVANIGPGSQDSRPHAFATINENLLFSASGSSTSQLFRTDGTTTNPLPVVARSEFVPWSNRLVFAGHPAPLGMIVPYSTDGVSFTEIKGTTGETLAGPDFFTRLDDDVYFLAYSSSEFGLYRTTDGSTANLVARLADFASSNITSSFEFKGSLYLKSDNRSQNTTTFYRSDGGLPVTVTTFQPPPELIVPDNDSSGNDPIFIGENQAYFSYGKGLNRALYAFDGIAFSPVDLGADYAAFDVIDLGSRVFLSARGLSANVQQLFELVGDSFVPLGPALESGTLFRGELFGINRDTPAPPFNLYHTAAGQLIALGDVAGAVTFVDPPVRFIEFNDQLYFNGKLGQNFELLAIVPVPEPNTLWIAGLTVVVVNWSRNRRPRGIFR